MAVQKPELIDVDPSALIIGSNIRRRPKTDDLVGSLKANGMLYPILAERTDDGITVVDGQRRTLAAIDAGMKSVPVLVTAKADEKMRLAAQFVSNEHRQALENIDRIDAVRELTLFGMSAAQIQKRTGLDKDTVAQASKVPATATAAVRDAGYTVDLEDLARLADLEGEPEHAVALAGLENRQPWQIADQWKAMQGRKLAAARREEIAAKHPGVVFLDSSPDYDSKQHVTVYRVEALDGSTRTSPLETLEEAIAFFGPALRVYVRAGIYYNGPFVNEAFYGEVKDLEAAGLRVRADHAAAAAAASATQEEKQQQKVAREAVKAWRDTADDRRTFLATLLTKKTPPAGWEQFVLTYVFSTPTTNYWSPTKAQAVAMMLGLDQLDIDTGSAIHSRDLLRAEIIKNQPHRAGHGLLAAALAEIEEGIAEGAATSGGAPKPFETHGHLADTTPAYLDQLEKWGYDAKAERAIIDGSAA